MKFWRNKDIERVAEQRLAEYEQKYGDLAYGPVPIEELLGSIYGLTVLWDSIHELPGETILGGLNPSDRLIVLNEKHINRFEEKPGLERSTLGHEAGHWEFHVDKGGLDHPTLFDHCRGISHHRNSGKGELEVFAGTGCVAQYLEALHRRDTSDEERVVNRFASALSMPGKLIAKAKADFDFCSWPDLYRMAEHFGVNISALKVRLEQLEYIYVDEARKIHSSRKEAFGQMKLF